MNCGDCSIAATTAADAVGGARLGGVRVELQHRRLLVGVQRPPPGAAAEAGDEARHAGGVARRRIAARDRGQARRRSRSAPPPPARRRPGSGRRAGWRRCTRSAMSSKPSVSSSGGSWSATDAGTPVRSEIVRPYSKRVIRRSGAGPGSAAHNGNVSLRRSVTAARPGQQRRQDDQSRAPSQHPKGTEYRPPVGSPGFRDQRDRGNSPCKSEVG